MAPLYACFPVLTFFAALGLLAVLVVLVGAYNRPATSQPQEPSAKAEFTWQWAIAIIITIVVPLGMLLAIWLLPEW